jgi:signal transduction histidine kinase
MGRQTVVDLAVGVVAGFGAALATVGSSEPGVEPSPVGAWLLGAALGALLVVRRRWPVPVLVLSLVVVMAYNLTGLPGVAPVWLLLVPLYTAALHGYVAVGAAVGGSALLVSAGWVLHAGQPVLELADGAVREAAVGALALVAGAAVCNRRRAGVEAQARVDAERRRREQETAGIVLAERLRIARELHDVTAHTVAVVGIQVELARALLDDDPSAARDVLAVTHRINTEAVRELQSAVRLLRAPTAHDPAVPDPPPPDESRLDELIDRATAGGLTVTFDRTGPSSPVPPQVGRALYRVLQESLTNVLRHAGAASARVNLIYADDAVTLEVVDDGGPVGPVTEGHGLTGMRERLATLGGTLVAGPAGGRGFAVRADIPLAGRR